MPKPNASYDVQTKRDIDKARSNYDSVSRAYHGLTEKEKALVNYDIQTNPDRYSSSTSAKNLSDNTLYNSSMQAKGLDAYIPDDWQSQIPKKNGVFNAIDSDGSINQIWQRAYDNLGILRPFLKINSKGTPDEETYAGDSTLQNLAYRRYHQLTTQYKAEAQAAEEEAKYAQRVYQKDGVIDEAATKAFQQLSLEEKRLINGFGSDGKPSAVATREEIEAYQHFQQLQEQLGVSSSSRSNQVFANSDGTIDRGKTRAFQELTADEQAIIAKLGKNGYPSGLTDAGDLAVFNKFDDATQRYNREYASQELARMQSGTKYATSTTVSGGSSAVNLSRMSDDEKKSLAKKYNISTEDVDEIISQLGKQMPAARRERIRASLGAPTAEQNATQKALRELPSYTAEDIANLANHDRTRAAYEARTIDKTIAAMEADVAAARKTASSSGASPAAKAEAKAIIDNYENLQARKKQAAKDNRVAGVVQETKELIDQIQALDEERQYYETVDIDGLRKQIDLIDQRLNESPTNMTLDQAVEYEQQLKQRKEELQVQIHQAESVQTYAKYMQEMREAGNYADELISRGIDKARQDTAVYDRYKAYERNGKISFNISSNPRVAAVEQQLENAAQRGLDYQALEGEERRLYEFVLGRDGQEAADRLLDALRGTLNYRRGEQLAKSIAETGGVERFFRTVGLAINVGLDQFDTGMLAATGQADEDRKYNATVMENASAITRERLGESGAKLPEWLGGATFAQAGYDAVTTTANMAPAMLISAGLTAAGLPQAAAGVVSAAVLGSSAGGNAYRKAIQEGRTETAARNFGVLTGASEGTLQYLIGGISALGGMATGATTEALLAKINSVGLRAAAEIGIDMLSEGSEEYWQDILEPVFRNICFDEKNQVRLWSEDAAYSFLLGAITAGLMEGPSTVTNAVNQQRITEARIAAENWDYIANLIAESDQAVIDIKPKAVTDEELERMRLHTGTYEEGTTQVLVPQERYDAVVNSSEELVKAAEHYEFLSTDLTQQLQSGRRMSTNEIRQYAANLKAAQDKLVQTQQAMTAARSNFDTALKEAKTRADEAMQAARERAEAERAAEQERLAAEQTQQNEADEELDGLFAGAVLTPEQSAALTNIADVNMALSQTDIETMQASGVARAQADELMRYYMGTVTQPNDAYVAQQLDTARDNFVQAAQAEIRQRGAQALGTTNVESARRITENRAANGIAPQSPADVETAQRNAVMQAPARATTQQLNAAVDAVVADPEVTRDNPMAQRQVTEAANELANREAQEQWANAKPGENIEGTYVDQDGVRRSVATDSYLRYNVAMPDDSRRGRTLRNRDTVSREFAAAFESYISVGNDPDIQESGATELAYDRSGLIKVKDYGDFQSVIHGVGHRVAELYGITDVLGVDNVWQQFPKAIQAQYNNDQDVLRGEAYAEAFKMYIYNPDYARQFWPEYVQLVEQNMTRRQRRAVREMSRAVRADNAASFGEKVDNTQTDKRTSENLVRRLAKSTFTREGHNQFIQRVFDPEIGLDELGQAAQRNLARAGEGGIERGAALPYQRANYNLSSNARANSVLYGIGTVDWDADGGPVRADVSLAEVIAPVVAKGEETQNLFYRYLKLVSAVDDERMGYAVFPKDITLDAQEQEIADLEKNNPEFVKVADDLFKWHHNYMFVRGAKTGLTSQASYNDMVEKRPHYLPFNRDIESNPSGSVGINKDIGPITGVRFGSRANTFNPIQQIAAQVYAIEALNDKVALRRQIYDIITNVPGMAIYASEVDGNQTLEHTTNDPAGDPDTWWYSQPSLFMDGNKLAVRLDSGQMKYLEIHDPALLAYFTDAASVAASMQEFDNLLKQGAEVVQTVNRIAAGLLTVHKPTFAITNAERDYPTAWAKSTQPIWQFPQFIGRQLVSIVENTAKLGSDIIGDNATENLGNLATKVLGKMLGEEKAASFNDFMGWTETPVGGTLSMMELYMATGMGQTELRGNINEPKNARAIMRRISPTKIDKFIAKGLDIWDALPTVGERSPRYAEFAYAMKQSGGDYVYATNEANRVTTDFRKGGKAVRAVKKWWLFAGANMNGLYQDWRILSGREYRNPDGTRDKGAQWNYIAKATSFTFLMSLASALSWKAIRKKYGNDDEEFIPDYVDDNSFTFAYDADGHYVKWRVPQSVYFAMNREVWELAYRAANDPSFDPPAAIKDMIADIASAASPAGDLGGPGEANPLGSSFLGASEINTFYLNKKWTNADIDYSWETTGKNATSPELHVGTHTTELAKWLGNATGLSPKQWDVELEQRGSYLYDMYGMLTDKEGLREGFKNYIGDIFVGNALYSTDVFNNVYNERDKIQVILNDIEESGSSPKYKRHLSEEDIMNANDEAEGLYQILDDAAGEMSDIRSEIAQLQADGAPEERILARQREMAIIAAEALYQTGLYKSNYLKLRER